MIKFQAKTEQGWTVDSPLQAFTFPDGAVHIKGVESEQKFTYQIADVRGTTHDDLFALGMWVDAVKSRKEQAVVILPYLPGARADRGVPFGAAIYAEFIARLEADQVITLDPHSAGWGGAFTSEAERLGTPTKFSVFPVERVIRKAVQDGSSDSKPQPYIGVIAPDKGAVDRATRAAKVMGVPVYRAGKTRDFETGKLTGFHMEDELPIDQTEGKFLIVDDICDGGGTFIGLADAIGLPMNRLDLWVTHGVFSKGLTELLRRFGTIHTTNSHIQAGTTYHPSNAPGTWYIPSAVKIHDVTAYLYGEIRA